MRGRRAIPFAVLAVSAIAFAWMQAGASASKSGGRDHVVEYWIAAVPVTWHVVPNERDAMMGE